MWGKLARENGTALRLCVQLGMQIEAVFIVAPTLDLFVRVVGRGQFFFCFRVRNSRQNVRQMNKHIMFIIFMVRLFNNSTFL